MSQTVFKLANLDLKWWDYLIFFFVNAVLEIRPSASCCQTSNTLNLALFSVPTVDSVQKQMALNTTHHLSWAYTNLETWSGSQFSIDELFMHVWRYFWLL